MNRKQFIEKLALGSAAAPVVAWTSDTKAKKMTDASNTVKGLVQPLALSMWEFSWLERRWPGAGFEDWDKVLDEFKERGYNAIRIDAFPHLIGENPDKEYTLLPVWNQSDWGSPAKINVKVQPNLNRFLAKCKEKKVAVGLSSWYREDVDNTRIKITSAEKMAENWVKTLDMIAKDDLLDTVFYTDMCNEWPGDLWAPYFKNDPPEATWGYWHTDKSMRWMEDTLSIVRQHYPDMPLCFSFDGDRVEYYAEKNLSFMDLLEHHTWMVKENEGEFYKKAGYNYDRFSPESYQNLADNGERIYREKPDYWQGLMTAKIDRVAKSAKVANQPLVTSECWGSVDYKDWPGLNWGWIKDLCALGTTTAAKTGQWVAIASSNFCEPQFRGMWRDVDWHQSLTYAIKSSRINEDLLDSKLVKRIGQMFS
jgi:hypothetical protein